jgi:hypothetical protein
MTNEKRAFVNRKSSIVNALELVPRRPIVLKTAKNRFYVEWWKPTVTRYPIIGREGK